MVRFAELPPSKLSSLLEENDAENTKKAYSISRSLAGKIIERSPVIGIYKVNLATVCICMSN